MLPNGLIASRLGKEVLTLWNVLNVGILHDSTLECLIPNKRK